MRPNRKTTKGQSPAAESHARRNPQSGDGSRVPEARFLDIFDKSPVALLVSNTSGRIIFANTQSHSLLGYEAGELIGAGIEQLVPEDARVSHAHSRASFNRRPSARPMTGRELKARRKDGGLFPVEIGLVPLDMDGDILILSSIVDLTERMEAEERFSKAFYNSPLPMTISTLGEGRFVDVNQSYSDLVGYPREELIGRTVLDVGVWANPSERERLVKRLRVGVSVRDEEIHFFNVGGEKRVAVAAFDVIELKGAPHLLGLFSDITEKRRSEEALRLSEARFRALTENNWDAIVLFDAEGRILYSSPSTTRVLGYEFDEVAGGNVFDLVHQDDQDATLKKFLLSLRKPGAPLHTSARLRHRDGSWRWLEGTLTNMLNVPGVHAVVSNYHDLTERQRMEEEIRRRANEVTLLYRLGLALAGGEDLYHALRAFVSELKQVMIVDAFHIGLYDAETDFFSYSLFLNLDQDIQPPPRKLSEKPGLTWEVISGRKTLYLEDVADPTVRSRHHIVVVVDAPIRSYLGIPLLLHDRVIGIMSVQSLQPGAYTQDQIRLLETIAAQVVVTIEKSRLFDRLQRELSERRHLIEELESKNAELERFTYTVSHDLKSPLVTINGFLGFLEKSAESGNMERFKKDKKRIEDAVSRMQNLLNELLELSRVGRIMSEPKVISFEDLVREALELVRGRMEAKGAVVFIHPNLPSVHGDKPRLIEVMQNLLDNAAKYMGDQEKPHIEVGHQGMENNKPVFFVRDNGMGILPEHHERIFGLFNKLDPASEGTGIGLALVKRIIELHGGRIWVESEAGKGSTFYFTLSGG